MQVSTYLKKKDNILDVITFVYLIIHCVIIKLCESMHEGKRHSNLQTVLKKKHASYLIPKNVLEVTIKLYALDNKKSYH